MTPRPSWNKNSLILKFLIFFPKSSLNVPLCDIKTMLEQKQCGYEIFHFFQESYESLNVTLCDIMTKLEQKQFDFNF
jgi:hypothetical protein